MGLVAVPYRQSTGDEAKDEARNRLILDSLVALPNLFQGNTASEDRVLVAAQTLVDPGNKVWEIWRDGTLVGILLLTRIVRGVDALAHLAFFDKKLVGKRSLLRNMIREAFRDLQLQRLSVEIPANLDPLIRFVRGKLGFRLEGETQAADHPALKALVGINNAPRWLAHWGSRREQMCFDGREWHDVICLRLLRTELEPDGRPDPTLGDPANPPRRGGDAAVESQPSELHSVRPRGPGPE